MESKFKNLVKKDIRNWRGKDLGELVIGAGALAVGIIIGLIGVLMSVLGVIVLAPGIVVLLAAWICIFVFPKSSLVVSMLMWALRRYHRILSTNPEGVLNFNSVILAIVLALFSMRFRKEALEYCSEVLTTNPKEINVLCFKSFMLLFSEKFEEALECCNEVLLIAPQNDVAISCKLIVFTYLKKEEELLKFYNEIPVFNREDKRSQEIRKKLIESANGVSAFNAALASF